MIVSIIAMKTMKMFKNKFSNEVQVLHGKIENPIKIDKMEFKHNAARTCGRVLS